MDLYSRKIIGWVMSPAMSTALICKALQMAIGQRQSAAELVLHSDRGSQYAKPMEAHQEVTEYIVGFY